MLEIYEERVVACCFGNLYDFASRDDLDAEGGADFVLPSEGYEVIWGDGDRLVC